MTGRCSPRRSFPRSGTPPVPPGTPPEIADRLTWEPRRPKKTSESGLGIPVALPSIQRVPENRLVVIGDSVSHGFKNFAISDTGNSWPAMVSRYAGFGEIRRPDYPGPTDCPGLPLNLEALLNSLDGDAPGFWHNLVDAGKLLSVGAPIVHLIDDYWERDEGSQLIEQSNQSGLLNQNLSIFGWDIRDAFAKTRASLRDDVEQANGFTWSLGGVFRKSFVSVPGSRAGLITMAGGDDDDTLVTLARKLGDQGRADEPGIETLVVALGANNILGTVLDFQIAWTESPQYADLTGKNGYNAWVPTHFEREYNELATEIETIKARHVIFFTVPHVTIAPMVRGVGDRMAGDRYFARYSRAWMTDAVFDPNHDACMTGDQLRVLDAAVDQYNDSIVARVAQARSDGKDWRVLDIAGILDRLAYRRYLVDDQALPEWWDDAGFGPYELPDCYRECSPVPDSRFYNSDRHGRSQGGLFSLDGVHPSTIGYGILAGEVMKVMADCVVNLGGNAEPNYSEILQSDTLMTNPPEYTACVLDVLKEIDRVVDFGTFLGGRPA